MNTPGSSGRCPAKDHAMLQMRSEAKLSASAGAVADEAERALLSSRWKPYEQAS